MQVPIQVLQLLLQNCQHSVNALVHHGKSTLAALEFGSVHLQDLPAAGYQGLEFLRLGIQQRPRLWPSGGTEVCQHLSIQAVGPFGYAQDGLGQLAQGAGKVPHLAWVDYGHWDTRNAQGCRDGDLIPSSGLQDHQVDPLLPECAHEALDSFRIGCHSPRLAHAVDGNIQPPLCYINPCVPQGF
jgi:hypothetical protein